MSMNDYISAHHAAFRLHNMGPPTEESTKLLSNMVIHNQILAALCRYEGENEDWVMGDVARSENLSDTSPTETTAFNDYRLSIMDSDRRVTADPNLYLHKGNPEEDTNELGLMYPHSGQFVVPVAVMYHNMKSMGGTIEDNAFVAWVNYRLHNTYPKRNYAVTHWRGSMPWQSLKWRRDVNVYVLCASSYLALPQLKWYWHRIPRSVYSIEGENVNVNVTFNTVTHEHKEGIIMRSYINDTQYGFDGVPILMYFVTPPEEQLMMKADQPYMVTIPNLYLHNEEQDKQLLNHVHRIGILERHNVGTAVATVPQTATFDVSNVTTQITDLTDRLETMEGYEISNHFTNLQARVGTVEMKVNELHELDIANKYPELEQLVHELQRRPITGIVDDRIARINGLYLDLWDRFRSLIRTRLV